MSHLHLFKADGEGSCDNCISQEGRHYCLLHSVVIKNMDLWRCSDFVENNNPLPSFNEKTSSKPRGAEAGPYPAGKEKYKEEEWKMLDSSAGKGYTVIMREGMCDKVYCPADEKAKAGPSRRFSDKSRLVEIPFGFPFSGRLIPPQRDNKKCSCLPSYRYRESDNVAISETSINATNRPLSKLPLTPDMRIVAFKDDILAGITTKQAKNW